MFFFIIKIEVIHTNFIIYDNILILACHNFINDNYQYQDPNTS